MGGHFSLCSPEAHPEAKAEVLYLRGEGNTGSRLEKGDGEENEAMKGLLSELPT